MCGFPTRSFLGRVGGSFSRTFFFLVFFSFCIILTCALFSHPHPDSIFFSFVINLEVEHSTGRHFLFFTFSPHPPEPHPLPSPPHPPFSRTSLIFQFCQLLWSENVAGEQSTASFSPIAKVEMGCVGYICLYAICKIIYRCLNQNGQSKGFRFLIYFFIETPFFFFILDTEIQEGTLYSGSQGGFR